MLRINFTPFPDLTTTRLKLRKMVSADVNDIYLLRSDERVNQFLDRTKAASLDDAAKFIQKISDSVKNNESLMWAVVLKINNRLIGTTCLWNINMEESKAEIGYELLPDFQAKGYMKEAISAVISYGFSTLQLQSMEAYTHKDNLASIALLEKNNFKRDLWAEGSAKDLPLQMVIYTLVKN